MRLIQLTAFCTALALPGIAQAQTQTVQGSQLAGLCAATLDFVAGARSTAGASAPQDLQIIQRTRGLYLGMPRFPAGEVEGYAHAWSERMAENLATASAAGRDGAVLTQIAEIARDCQKQMFAEYRAAQQRGEIPQNQPVAPQPQPVQPLTVTPQ